MANIDFYNRKKISKLYLGLLFDLGCLNFVANNQARKPKLQPPNSNNQAQAPKLKQPSSNNQAQTTKLKHPSSNNKPRTTNLRDWMFELGCLSLGV
jgi:hypothetical protein